MLATALTRAVPLAFAAGLNVYATVAVIGLVAHYHLVALPDQFRAFDSPIVIGAARAIAALVGGSVAMTTHATKAGTRAAANTSPEPFSNWFLSFGEDVLAVSISYAAMKHPLLALTIAAILLVVIIAFASFLIRAIKRRFTARPA